MPTDQWFSTFFVLVHPLNLFKKLYTLASVCWQPRAWRQLDLLDVVQHWRLIVDHATTSAEIDLVLTKKFLTTAFRHVLHHSYEGAPVATRLKLSYMYCVGYKTRNAIHCRSIHDQVFQGLTLVTVKTFWETASTSSEYPEIVTKRGFTWFIFVVVLQWWSTAFWEIVGKIWETTSVTQNTLKTLSITQKSCSQARVYRFANWRV